MGETILMLIKLVLGILLLPIVLSCALNLYPHILGPDWSNGEFFLWGMFAFLMTFIFLYQFGSVYEFGQKMISQLFKFLAPFDQFIVKAIPFYFVILSLIFFVVKVGLKIDSNDHIFMFFLGFLFAMHVILIGQELQQSEKSSIKPAYFFMMGIYFVINVCVLILMLDLTYRKFSFPKFYEQTSKQAASMYKASLKKVIEVKKK